MSNPISKAPTPTLASGVSEVEMGSSTFTANSDLSPIIVVDREPVKIVSFNITGNTALVVNHIATIGSTEIMEPYRPNGEEVTLNANRNEVILHRSGRYRLEARNIQTQVTAFWWQFSMTHEWYDEIAEALRFLCSCVSPQDVQLVAGPGIAIENLGGGSWRISNTGIINASNSTTVEHQVTNGVLNSHVKISEDPNNELFARDDGLYATVNVSNVPCALGQAIQPTAIPVRNLRFVVLDNNNCLRWVSPRALANYVCDYDCEGEPPPPPSNCCNLVFNHTVSFPTLVEVGSTATITITATGSNAAICRAVTNSVNISSALGNLNGWQLDNTSFTGANPFTLVDFNTSNITTWSLTLRFIATECNSNGRVISLTPTGFCRNAQGQLIPNSQITYPISVTLPAITDKCGEPPPPPPSCCGLSISSSTIIPPGPLAVGDTITIQITSIASTFASCHGRLFVNNLADLVGSGWVIDSVTSSPPGQSIQTGVNHNAAGSNTIVNTIVLRATECVSASTRTLTVSGACFNEFSNQITNTFVQETFTYNLPQVNANCSGGPGPECGISFSGIITYPNPPVTVGSTLTVQITVNGSNNPNNKTVSLPLGIPFPIGSGWSFPSITISGLPPSFDPITQPVDFAAAGVTSFTVTYTYTATALTQGNPGVGIITPSALCRNALGQDIDGSFRSAEYQVVWPQIVAGGGGGPPTPNCCGLSIDQSPLQNLTRPPSEVVHKCDEFAYSITATTTTNTAQCHAVTQAFNPFYVPPPFVNKYQVYNVVATRADGSPLPPGVNPANGVDFFAAGITDWKVTIFIRILQCFSEPMDHILTIRGACVNQQGIPIGDVQEFITDIIVPMAQAGCSEPCP